ncbi:purine phosphorylase [Actinoplanes sp. ATCC 53533]|uniref:5'-methylthioadenosine/S-adenosylhomocysteine nucleosidase n=1 Tax=Actinoplanes sp. ATCC 53533 TaxID=1288362 RepID=UPI000F791536|nr:5'-methylthioadenosine/S-adenosylhomocysteine nucleosidase [Actinoplanes sp. ATCC 53533]RSM56771.1 purine phosphorylase [Actinoplanes sp. ATCC 53533]
MKPRPIVILTALDLEYRAVSKMLVDPEVRTHEHGTRFEVGRLAGSGVEVALALVGKGTHPAAVLTERAIGEFAPAALIFVGIAGALHSHIALGDVVVATHIYAYHGGTSEDDGTKSRPRVWETSHRADQIARHLARHSSARIHFGPIAAGEMVLNSKVSAQARWVREHYNDALAIEMEGAGVAQAGHLSGGLPVVVVRGISDRADGTKETTDRNRWQQKAIVDAATFAAALAVELAGPAAGGSRRNGERPMTTANLTVHNIASDNAWVGVQAGQVYGGVSIGAAQHDTGDLAELLADFHRRLGHAGEAGALDEDDFAAAEAELSIVHKSLAQSPPDLRTLKTALKRLLGLVSEVTELATRLTAIIHLVRGLQ